MERMVFSIVTYFQDKCVNKKASVFCLASYAEGFPMAVLDAWSYGIPVISTPVGGLPDVLLDGENVLFFQPGDIDGLSDKLKCLLTDGSLRLRLSDASLCLANGEFSVSYVNEQMVDLYGNL
jgi:glycosyltransferase involved in cell wall biosynthesis